MPNNRLSLFFDRKPTRRKSTSFLSAEVSRDPVQTQWGVANKSKSRETLAVMQEYNNVSKPLPPLPPTTSSIQAHRPIGQHRSSTAPVMHPPDELFLKMIRRRSADARMEEVRVQRDDWQKHDPGLAMSLAISSALPPTFLDAYPRYITPKADIGSSQPYRKRAERRRPHHIQSSATITKFREDELFLEDPLRVQIDETIAQYASFHLTQPTPTMPSRNAIAIVSPMNETDRMNLERRKKNKKGQRIADRDSRPNNDQRTT